MIRLRHTIVLTLGLLAVSCSSDDPPTSPALGGGDDRQMHTMERLKEKYEVSYQPGTVIVSNEAMRYMARPVFDSNELVFSLDAKPHLDLEENAVTIFPMAALVRVVSWRESGDSIIVQTEPAALTDAIKDADIESVVEIGWSQVVSQHAAPESGIRFSLIPAAHAGEETGRMYGSISQSFEHEGIKLTYSLKPQSADRLNFQITLSANKEMYKKALKQEDLERKYPTSYVNGDAFQPVRADESYGDNTRDTGTGADYSQPPSEAGGSNYLGDTGGGVSANVKGAIGFAKATGHISGFQQWFDLKISDGVPQDVYIDFKSLSGEVKLEAATLAGLVSTMQLSVPIEYVVTVPIGGIIPLTFTIGADLSFRPIIERGTSGSSKLCMMFAYDGSTGLRYSNGSFSNESTFRKRTASMCKNDETVSAGRLTVGLGTTFKVPRFKVSLFRLPIATSIYFMMDGVTTYEPGIASAMQACQAGKQHLAVIAQATMKLLGIINTEVHAKLWDLKKEWTCEKKLVTTTFDKAGGEQKSESGL
ncbi:MAG: hypothetical protein AAFX56_12240 [Pseudomonadota bacterium]